MLLISGTGYTADKKPFEEKQEVMCQTTLNGGTADFYIRTEDNPAWTLVTALDDVPVTIRIPQKGFYKVELTGSAVVYGDWE